MNIGDKVILPYGDNFGLHKREKGTIEKKQSDIYAVRIKDDQYVHVREELLKYDKS